MSCLHGNLYADTHTHTPVVVVAGMAEHGHGGVSIGLVGLSELQRGNEAVVHDVVHLPGDLTLAEGRQV